VIVRKGYPYDGVGSYPPALSIHNISSSNIQNNEHVIEGQKKEKWGQSGDRITKQRKGGDNLELANSPIY
jgi:hypothetical protein